METPTVIPTLTLTLPLTNPDREPVSRFSALTPSGFGADRPLFNPDEPPYEVERESVSRP